MNFELLFLHALPLDGAMWAHQTSLAQGSTVAPKLYTLGNSLEEWAAGALRLSTSDRLIVVGCSVGGSCAIEVAAASSERVAALVLIGTKATHRPDPKFRDSALALLERSGIDAAWQTYWAPLFSQTTDLKVVEAARQNAIQQLPADIARGIKVFHTRPSQDRFLANWRKPLVIITGEDDVAPGVATSTEMASSSAQGQLYIIPSCGHYVPLEQPDALNKILNEVIDTVTDRHGR